MTEFNCIWTLADSPLLRASVARSCLSFVKDARYAAPTVSMLDPQELFDPQPFPHGAYGYFQRDVASIAMSRITRKEPDSGAFYVVDDLQMPQHLRLSVYLRNADHAGWFSGHHHSQFLWFDGSKTIGADAELRQEYRTLKSEVVRHAIRVEVDGQQYYVLPGAAAGFLAGSAATTYGSEFDSRITDQLQAR